MIRHVVAIPILRWDHPRDVPAPAIFRPECDDRSGFVIKVAAPSSRKTAEGAPSAGDSSSITSTRSRRAVRQQPETFSSAVALTINTRRAFVSAHRPPAKMHGDGQLLELTGSVRTESM